MEVETPTYLTNYYHYCFFHAYLDFTIPLLSILHEIDSQKLANREFRLFMLKDTLFIIPSDKEEYCEEEIINANTKYLNKFINFEKGEFLGEYAHFHKAVSKSPVLFEEGLNGTYDFIHFSQIILHGNISHQRCIHNLESNYPDRYTGEAHATDLQIRGWIENGKTYLEKYLELEPVAAASAKKRMVIIARKNNRSMLPASLTRLEIIYGECEDIEFLGIVWLEEMNLKEQIELFRNVDIIVSRHGSGLAHLIWSKPGTKVYEIWLSCDRRYPIFERICSIMELSYKPHFMKKGMFDICDESFNIDSDTIEEMDAFIR